MFTTYLLPYAIPPQDFETDEPNSIENVYALIQMVLQYDPNRTEAEDTLTAAFSAEAALDPPDTVEKLYAALPDPNISAIQYLYDLLTTVSTNYPPPPPAPLW